MGTELLNFVSAITTAVNAQLLEKDQAKRLLSYYIQSNVNYSIKDDKEVKNATK